MLVSYASEHMNLKKEIIDSVVPLIKYTGSDDSQMLQFFFFNLDFRQCPICFGKDKPSKHQSPNFRKWLGEEKK